jgi:hypothetical protein
MHLSKVLKPSPTSWPPEMDEIKYTTALAKGQGIIEETLTLLRIWKPGMSAQGLVEVAVREGALRRATAKRTRDLIVEAFARRYLIDNGRPARQLKALLETGADSRELTQLFFIYTARANAIMKDFVSEVYWGKYSAGATYITKEDALSFLERAYSLGKLPKKWSEKMMLRVASYLGGCLADFQLIENRKTSSRKISPFSISSVTTLYLAHELHFSGNSDNAIPDHPDWSLFGLQKIETIRELQRVANDHFILQFSGELLRFSWKYKSMEDAIHGIV